ncbi:AfsR/SARP family transcriptional regulator [Actinokineospora sp. HUAS TT18]|uniref:AfsR/SARP family transcriptional regulator n=1 Tax=Actinokineospora sp. HUAS TT18 TaxID=3447451 RepID=UPI003F527C5A
MILILGRPVVRSGAAEVRPGRRMARALLGMFALRANRVLGSEWIVDGLWPVRPPRSAAANVRSHVAELRRLLGPVGPRIETSGDGYVLLARPDDVDATLFGQLVAESHRHRDAGAAVAAADCLTHALGLWRGTVLEGVPVPEVVRSDAAVLDEARGCAAEELGDLRLALGQHHDLIPALTGLVIDYPLRERLWHQLMLALVRTGRRGEAMAVYRRLAALLDAELGVPPSAVTTELFTAIQREATC